MRYQATKRHGGVLNAHCEVKEANLKSLYTVWFQLYDILEKAKLWRQWKDQWLPGVGTGMNRQSMEEFWGSETILYDVTMVDTCLYTFVQTHRMSNTKSEP